MNPDFPTNQKIYIALKLTDKPLRCCELAAMFQMTSRGMASTLRHMMRDADKFPELRRGAFAGGFLYSANDNLPKPKPRKVKAIPPPHRIMEDLWRGWYNPLSGITGDRLGAIVDPTHRSES